MTFGTIIRSASTGETNPTGIGGDSTVIWHCSGRKYGWSIQERSTINFSHIRHRACIAPVRIPRIGGKSNIIWHCEYANRIYELAVSNFSIIKSLSGPGSNLFGIGGNQTTLYVTRRYISTLYKLNPTNASIIQTGATLGTGPSDVGGTENKIWHTDTNSNKIYYLNKNDFSIIQSAPFGSYSTGTGGNNNTIYCCDIHTDRIYELETPIDAINLFPDTITQIGPV